MAMIFQKTSTRTRLSFESGVFALGGHAVYMDWKTTNFALSEVRDEIRYVSGNCDIVVARLLHHEDLVEMMRFSLVPVVNGCCDRYHPCQAFSDLLTLLEQFGKLDGLGVVYAGVWNNVLNSLMDVCMKTGVHLTAVTPVINEAVVDESLRQEALRSGYFHEGEDLASEAKNADVVYTDTWIDMEFFLDPRYEPEKKRRTERLMPVQVNAKALSGSSALVMHDMPIHAGCEIDRELVESDRSLIFPQAWNRMYGQNALVLRLLRFI
jgi:ornithine carbamoyltransferase